MTTTLPIEATPSPVDQYNQPVYAAGAFETVKDQIESIRGIAHPHRIIAARELLGALSTGDIRAKVAILGSCSPEIRTDDEHITRTVSKLIEMKRSARESLGPHILFYRELNQGIKRRSQPTVQVDDEATIPNYLGDGVNAIEEDASSRQPDPRRLITMAEHARLVIEGLRSKGELAGPIYTSHDMLSTDYEGCFVVTENGKRYITTGVLLWLGYNARNNAETPQADLLAMVQNPAGVKIGPNNTEAYIEEVVSRLRGSDDPDKPIVFMMRFGNNQNQLHEMIRAINTVKGIKNTTVAYDVHGTTVGAKDRLDRPCKTRKIPEIIKGIEVLRAECRKLGVPFVGANLEISTKAGYYECTDGTNRAPNGEARVDPELNLPQMQHVLSHI